MKIIIIILNLCGTTYLKIKYNDNNKKNLGMCYAQVETCPIDVTLYEFYS